ncbi:MAG: hypothetical protein JNJ77_06615 [Planctomycetia bacterium]|nr:hypothetical protein [Planctomycetia bacterium]
MNRLSPVLNPEEYIEQEYFFRTFRERHQDGRPSQEILDRIHEELLSTTRLPLAVQFMAVELKHSGLLGTAMTHLSHYFNPFQAFIIAKAEEEGKRFSMDIALKILEDEARYRSYQPIPEALFVFQFEVLCRNRLGYDHGMNAMMLDSFYDQEWREYLETVRRNIGEIEFADLVFVRSEAYAAKHRQKYPEKPLPRVLFGEKEGKIARANRGRDPLYLFAALQRHLGYPPVPYIRAKTNPLEQLPTLVAKLREMEQRVKLIENDLRERRSTSVPLAENNDIRPVELDD